MKEMKSEGLERAMNLLNQSIVAADKRIEDLVVEGTFSSLLRSTTAKPHTSDETKIVNIVHQNHMKIEILKTFTTHVQKLLEEIKAHKKENNEITVKMKDIQKLFDEQPESSSSPILKEERKNFINDGHMMIFSVEKKWTWSWKAFFVTALGALQVAGGIFLTTFSAGTLSKFGLDLIMEGISDLVEGIKGIIEGGINLINWLISKAISIGVSLLSFGISKGIKWIKNGFKMSGSGIKSAGRGLLAGFTKVGWKQSAKEAMKYVGKCLVENVAYELVSEGFDRAIKSGVDEAVDGFLLHKIKNRLREGFIKVVVIL